MSELRRRNKKKEKNKKGDQKDAAAAGASTPPLPHTEATLWQTFTSHPLVKIAPIVLIPYALYTAFYYFTLKRPDLLATGTLGLVRLRPALNTTDERQLLIVGSMSSGTVQVSADLYDHLKLEIGHEVSNAEQFFVRDGTVSWFHGIRFLEPPASSEEKVKAWSQLCTNHTENMGFHPRMYKTSESCSVRQKWSNCWARECILVVFNEWGCAFHKTCETPFHATLHQVRHPLHTMESLVTKFCQGGLNGTLHPSFVTFMSVLFPTHEWESLSCIEAAGHYVVDFNLALLEAQKQGLLNGMYKIEDSSPCDVARMAGLLDKDQVVYPPHFERLTKVCDITAGESNPAQEVMVSTKHKINIDLVNLDWEDLRGGKHGSQRPDGDTTLEEQVKELMTTLGYDPNEPRATAGETTEDEEEF